MFNYRGYVRSKGTATPELCRKDGEAMIDFMRNTFKMKKIGVHGQSIGGLTGTYLAKKKNLDLLVADRTFSSLGDVIEAKFNCWLIYWSYYLCTLWDTYNPADYIDSKCFKVLLFDANDKMMCIHQSIKNGISKELIIRKQLKGKKSIRSRRYFYNEKTMKLSCCLLRSYMRVRNAIHNLRKNICR